MRKNTQKPVVVDTGNIIIGDFFFFPHFFSPQNQKKYQKSTEPYQKLKKFFFQKKAKKS